MTSSPSDSVRIDKNSKSFLGHLKFLLPSFGQSYIQSISNFRSSRLLKLYYESEVIEKTYGDFADDVEMVREKINLESNVNDQIVCLNDNSYEMLVYSTASLLEGRTLCPINPMEGEARISKKLKTLGNEITVYSKNIPSLEYLDIAKPMLIPKIVQPICSIQEPKKFREAQPFINIFTSGTTGISKVVQQKELGVLINVDALIERHGLYQRKKIGTCLPIYHVNALEFSFFGTLLSGGSLVLFNKFDIFQMVESLENKEIEILSVVPSIINAFLSVREKLPKNVFSNLDYFVSAAAPITKALAEKIYLELPCRVVQGYGLSEAVNFSALNPIDLSPEEYKWSLLSGPRPSVGTAVRGGEVFILDKSGEILGEEKIGEVCLKGLHLMHGYLGEPPSVTFSDGFFHTGDLGFFKNGKNSEKFYFITGRIKEIIKRSGTTISLSELEDELDGFPAKKFDAIAVGFSNTIVGEEVAIVISGELPSGGLQEIAKYMTVKLPSFLRPHLYIFTNKSVRGPSGKSNRSEFLKFLAKFEMFEFAEKDFFENDNS